MHLLMILLRELKELAENAPPLVRHNTSLILEAASAETENQLVPVKDVEGNHYLAVVSPEKGGLYIVAKLDFPHPADIVFGNETLHVTELKNHADTH